MKYFLGVITHPASRFNSRGEAAEQLRSLASVLERAGHDVSYLVSDRNDFSAKELTLGIGSRIWSAWAQARTECRWRRYLVTGPEQRPSGARWDIQRATSTVRRCLSAAGVPGAGGDLSEAGLRRLLNIDLSHLRLWRAAQNTEADIALILEDDAVWNSELDPQDICTLLDQLPATDRSFAVLSHSLSISDLAVGALHSVAAKKIQDNGALIELPTPITNTVCANAYSLHMINLLLASIQEGALVPVQPIDWRLNQVLIDHSDVRCFWADPAPFIQSSMHSVS